MTGYSPPLCGSMARPGCCLKIFDALQFHISLVEAEEIPSCTLLEITGLHCIIDVSAYNRVSYPFNETTYMF